MDIRMMHLFVASLSKINGAISRHTAWRNLAETHNWVDIFGVIPGKIFIPLYATVCIKSITEQIKNDAPKKSRNTLLVKRKVLITIMNKQIPIITEAISIEK